ncbi:hypothetical protein L3X38_036818 [Prunus dulcis]|uniref:Uncharacterized protein n=1 Tax=Prunus dulcis TaxID=3755 RepID=A0AAD4V3F1_PRUDU|nr:hypothetical protein L3X38_036818 [Prunus dulcis]
MASKKIQTAPTTKGKSVSASFSSGDSAGVVTRSKAKADERNSRSEERSFSGSKNSRELLLSPVSDVDSSTGLYHGSPPDDQQKKLTSASVGESYSMAMQVMVTGAMSIDEQLAHMSEAITKLTKMVEEKDAQIASLINKWEAHQDKEPGQDAHKKAPHHEAKSSKKGLGHEIESDVDEIADAKVATIVFGSFDPYCRKYWNSNQQGAYTRSETHEEQKVLTQVEDSPSHFNIEEAVELPEAIHIALVKMLMDLNIHPNQIRKAKKLEPESQDRAICCPTCASITFTDEDVLLGSKPHNRPLFVSGYVRE